MSANTWRVVDQALLWLGLTAEEVKQGWATPESHPINEDVYNVLNRMTFQFPNRAPCGLEKFYSKGQGIGACLEIQIVRRLGHISLPAD